jgi:hypothetical protein
LDTGVSSGCFITGQKLYEGIYEVRNGAPLAKVFPLSPCAGYVCMQSMNAATRQPGGPLHDFWAKEIRSDLAEANS